MDTAPRLHPTRQVDYLDLVSWHFLSEAQRRDLPALRGDNWTSSASLFDSGLEVLASARYDYNGAEEVLLTLGSGIAHVIQRERAITARIAAPDDATAERLEAELRDALPARGVTHDGMVEVRVWWAQAQGRSANVVRSVPAPAWNEISGNYAASVRDRLGWLMARTPPLDTGRLVLFHGPPGTGKTHAMLALAAAWENWLDTEIVSDPELLFGSPQYLLDVVTRGREARSKRDRWQLLVVEDAGEFLTPYAKTDNGQALSRLLNITDGVLGRATRTVVLATTNEHLSHLHEAIARPGRCLAEIAFSPLSEDEVDSWCTRHDTTPDGRSSMTLAELYGLLSPAALTTPQAQSFGFA